MKVVYIIVVWLIGISAIFGCMIGLMNIRNYFPFGLVAINGWSFLLYKACQQKKITHED